jgi:hypothetical protein
LSFSQLKIEITTIYGKGTTPLNILLEAPLSVAFGSNGNPAGRSIERRNRQTRYWYVGLNCSVLVAATYLLRSMSELSVSREIRLFEGLVSFKPNGVPSSHTQDVIALRNVAWSQGESFPPEELASKHGDRVVSAFRVAGMDFGVPPVVCVGG